MQALAARRLELTFDEAYYTLWSRSLSFGYLDHPPMVALLIRASTALFGEVRIWRAGAFAPRCVGAMPALIAFIAWRLFGSAEKAALAALMWIAMPLVAIGALFVTPDAPLVVFWTLGLAALVELWRTGQRRWLLAIGLALGLALQSKFTAAFFAAGVGLALAATPSLRRWLVSPALYAGLAVALAIFAPFVVWNAEHGWATFAKQLGRAPPHGFHALLSGRVPGRADRADQSARFRRAHSRGRGHPLARARCGAFGATRPGAFSPARSRPRRSISSCIRCTTASRATGLRRFIRPRRFWSRTGSPRSRRAERRRLRRRARQSGAMGCADRDRRRGADLRGDHDRRRHARAGQSAGAP